MVRKISGMVGPFRIASAGTNQQQITKPVTVQRRESMSTETPVSNHKAAIFNISQALSQLAAQAAHIQTGLVHLSLTPDLPGTAEPTDFYAAAAIGWGITRSEAKKRIHELAYNLQPATVEQTATAIIQEDVDASEASLSPSGIDRSGDTPAKKPVTKTTSSADLDKKPEQAAPTTLVIPQSDRDLLEPYVLKTISSGSNSISGIFSKTWDFIKRKPRVSPTTYTGKTQQEWNNWLATAFPAGVLVQIGQLKLLVGVNGTFRKT